MSNFEVVDVPAHDDLMLRKLWIHKMRVVPSTYNKVIKFHTEEGIMENLGDQEKARSCNNATIKQRKQK